MVTGYLIEDMSPHVGDIYVCWTSLSDAQRYKSRFPGYRIYSITGEHLGYDTIPETKPYGAVQGVKIKAQQITIASY